MVERKRIYRIVHEKYLLEFLRNNFPPGSYRINVRLGRIDKDYLGIDIPHQRIKAISFLLPYADAIVIMNDKVIIVEAKIFPDAGVISKLKMYEILFRQTLEFSEHWNKKIELWLVSPILSEFLRSLCVRDGIFYVVYRPKWIEPYLWSYPTYQREGHYSGLKPELS